MVYIYSNNNIEEFVKSEKPQILYRSLARIDIPDSTQLEQILRDRGIKSKAQLFLDDNKYIREKYKYWTVSKILDKYGDIIRGEKFHEEYQDRGALYDELECRGPSPLISTHPEKQILLNWRKGPIFTIKSHKLKAVNAMPFGYMVLNLIPVNSLIGITTFFKNDIEIYKKILSSHGINHISVTAAVT